MTTLNLGLIRLNWKGDWSAATNYAVNDCVHYGGDSFVCTSASLNKVPKTNGVIDPTGWSYMARGMTALTTKGDLVYHDGATMVRLPLGVAGQVLTVDSTGVPVWASPPFRPAQIAWSGGLPSFRAGYGQGGEGASCMAIMADRRRLKTLGRSLYGSGCYGNTADVSTGFPQDVVLATPLASNEYFVGVRSNHWCHFAWTNLGNVYSGGLNNYGQLGQGDTNNRAWMDKVAFFSTNNIQITKVGISVNVQAGLTTAHFLDSAGRMWACGYNAQGQLGDGSTTNRSTPVQCGSLTGLIDFDLCAASATAVYAWKADGSLFTWGYNGLGQQGLGDATNRLVPTPHTINGVKYVRCAAGNYSGASEFYRAYVLKTDGTVWSAGDNTGGYLGVGDNTARNAWTQVPALVNVRDLYVGNGGVNTVYAITNANGTNANQTYCWGQPNGGSSLWQADTAARSSPVLFGGSAANAQNWAKFWPVSFYTDNCVIGQKTDGTFWFAGKAPQGAGLHAASGNVAMTQMADLGKYNITDISVCQQEHTGSGLTFYFMTASGEILSAGNDTYGLLGCVSVNFTSRTGPQSVRF